MFFKIGVLKNFVIFTGNHLRPANLIIIKKNSTQMFSCEFCEISKRTFFYGALREDCFRKLYLNIELSHYQNGPVTS